jgi:hypothetical protein
MGRMLCDFASKLRDLFPLRMTSCCIEGVDVAQRFLALTDLDTPSVQGLRWRHYDVFEEVAAVLTLMVSKKR